MQLPWEFSVGAEPGSGVENLPSDDGADMGRELARLTGPCIRRAQAMHPEIPRPCNECAFVAGTVPNRCLPTVADVLKCLAEKVPFHCHKGDGEQLCAGFMGTLIGAEKKA